MPETAAGLEGRDPVARRLPWLTLPIHVWVGVLIVVPNVLLLLYSFWTASDIEVSYAPTLANYADVFGSSTYIGLLIRTVLVSLAVAVFASVIAFPLAYIVSKKLSKRRLLAVMLVVVPLWVSLLIRVFAWKIILGDSGLINTGLEALGIIDHPIGFLLYTRFTVFLTLTYVTIPFVFIAAYTSLERVPPSVLEASADLGASPWRRFRSVTWPLVRQGVAIGFTLAFVLSVGDYLSPSLVGGLNGTMIGTVIISQFGVVNNWPLGAALAVALLIAVIAIAVVVARLGRARGTLEGDAGEGVLTDAVSASSRTRAVGNALAYGYLILVFAFLYVPLLCIAVFSLNDSSVQTLPLKGWTVQWYRELTESPELVSAFQRSVVIGLGAVALSALLATVFALVFTYRAPRAARFLQGVMMIPFLLPGVILGLSLAIVFRELGFPFGTVTVMIGHATFITPIIMGVLLTRLRQMDPSIAQASLDLGASPAQTFFRVLLPQLRTALIGGCLLGFTLSFDEVLVTFFLVGGDQTLPTYVYNQLRFGFTPTINALFTLIAIGSVTLLLVGLRLVARGSNQQGDRVGLPVGGAPL